MPGKREIEAALAHLFARAQMELPLTGPDEQVIETASSLKKNRVYRQIRRVMERGGSLSEALADVKGLPAFSLQAIRQGERAGRQAAAMKMVMDHYPVHYQFQHHVRWIYAYVLAVVISLAAFLLLYAHYVLPMILLSAELGGFGDVSARYGWLNLFRNPITNVVLVAGAVLLILTIHFRFPMDVLGALIRKVPILRPAFFKVVSLELGLLFRNGLALGMTDEQALEKAADGIGDKVIRRALKQAVQEVRNGETLSKALVSKPILKALPAVEAIRLGTLSGRIGELLQEQSSFLMEYLDENMEKEMALLLKSCVVMCGVLVGACVFYAFKMVVSAYDYGYGAF